MLLIKSIHMLAAAISILGFIARGILMIMESPTLQKKWVRIVPHINDTILLVSAIALATLMNQNPIDNSWLTAKVVGLLIYIALGMVALRFGKSKGQRITAWVLAIITFGYIVSVARTHSPLGLFA